MSSDLPEDPFPDDTSSSESATLEPFCPKIDGVEKPDKEEGALFIPAKATVGENPIIDVKASIQRRAAINKQKLNSAPPGTAIKRDAEPDKKKNKEKRKEQKDP